MEKNIWLILPLMMMFLSFAACAAETEETPGSDIESIEATITPLLPPMTTSTTRVPPSPTITKTLEPWEVAMYTALTAEATYGYTRTATGTSQPAYSYTPRPTAERIVKPTSFAPRCVTNDVAISEDEVDHLKFMSLNFIKWLQDFQGYRPRYSNNNMIILDEYVSDYLMTRWENNFHFGFDDLPYWNLSEYLADLEAAIQNGIYPEWAKYKNNREDETWQIHEFSYDPQYINYEIIYFEEQLSGIKFLLENDNLVIGDGSIEIETRLSEEINCTQFVLEDGYTIPFCTEPDILISVENLCYQRNSKAFIREDLFDMPNTGYERASFKYFPDLISVVIGISGVEGMVMYSPPDDQLVLEIDCNPYEEFSHTWYYGNSPQNRDEFMILTSDIAVQEKPCLLADSNAPLMTDRFFEVDQHWRKVILGEKAEALFEEMKPTDDE